MDEGGEREKRVCGPKGFRGLHGTGKRKRSSVSLASSLIWALWNGGVVLDHLQMVAYGLTLLLISECLKNVQSERVRMEVPMDFSNLGPNQSSAQCLAIHSTASDSNKRPD